MKKHLLSQKLFRAYIGWFICFMIVLLSISIGFMAFMIHRNFEDPQEQLINSIDENVQNYFEEMNAFSMELMNDQTFKKTAVIQLPQEYAGGKSTTESFSQLYRDAYKMFQKSYKCEEGLKSENVLSNQINGMGLVNVYARMQLFYGKESMLYQIEENRGSVIIGKRNRKDDLPI